MPCCSQQQMLFSRFCGNHPGLSNHYKKEEISPSSKARHRHWDYLIPVGLHIMLRKKAPALNNHLRYCPPCKPSFSSPRNMKRDDMMVWQEVGPALQLTQFIYSSIRLVFPVELDLGSELVHGKPPEGVPLKPVAKSRGSPVTRRRDLCKMKMFLSLLLVAIACMEFGKFLL